MAALAGVSGVGLLSNMVRRLTMVFNDDSKVVDDPNKARREVIQSVLALT